MYLYLYVLQNNSQPEWRNLPSAVTSYCNNIPFIVNCFHLASTILQAVVMSWHSSDEDSRTHTKGIRKGACKSFVFERYVDTCQGLARENEVRERIPHTCPSSYENFFQSILGSLSILRMAPHWSVKRLTSCSHGNNKQK